MKNKPVTYLLGAVALVVWGLIIYRLFAAAGDDGPGSNFKTLTKHDHKEVVYDYAPVNDTTKLLLSYRNPFIPANVKDTNVIAVKNLVSRHRAVINKPAVINWSFIRYYGYIKNPDSKNLIALMNINGKSLMLTEGETAERVSLLKNMQDSVKVRYEGKIKFIPMAQKTL